MPSPKPALSANRAVNPELVDKTEGHEIEEALHQRLAERAYALYEESGRQDGNDQKNWLQARSEIVKSLEMRKSGTWVSLTASIPDASPDRIRVYVDVNRVLVRAERTADAASQAEGPAHDTSKFFGVDFDIELDPQTATTSFKDQTLHLMVKKRRSVRTAGA
jgi:HSP20 family molecular chaperone IbpA